MSIGHGDRVDVVLDCVPGERHGAPFQLVYVRLVTDGSVQLPPVPPGARRNVVQTWFGVQAPVGGVAAFAIEVPAERYPIMDAEPGAAAGA